MVQRAIRFGVREGDRCASTWKLWTGRASAKQAEVYLANRALRGELHASMHEHGGWHITHTKPFFETDVRGVIPQLTERFLERWPPEIAPGVTLAFLILTPWTSTTGEICRDKRVVWLPNAPPGKATEVAVLLTAPRTKVSGWPGRKRMGTTLIDSPLPLMNGETAWAVHRLTVAPDLSKLPPGRGTFYRDKGPADLESPAANLRALLFGDAPNGARVIVDCAVLPKDASGSR